MSTPIELKYGQNTLRLRKKPDLVGLALRGDRPSSRRAVARLRGSTLAPRLTLGGFSLFDVPSADAEHRLDEWRRDPAVRAGTHIWSEVSDDASVFVPTGEIFVRWNELSTPDTRNAVIGEFALMIAETHGPNDTIFRTTRRSPNPVKVAAAIQARGLAVVAEPDFDGPARSASFQVPDADDLAEQWHLENSGTIDGNPDGLKKDADARVVAAWREAQTLGEPGVVIAVLDDGFDLEHPDFATLKARGGIVGPWDFESGTPNPRPRYYLAFDELVGDWHGTPCASVALAQPGNGRALGAAPGCSFMPLRRGPGLGDRKVKRMFDHVAQSGASVVSCSWGGEARVYHLSTLKSEAIERCAKHGRDGRGVVVVFAAGNEAEDNFVPDRSDNGFANHPDVLCVAASTSRDERADYSNFGDRIALCAPSSGAGGRGIIAADVSDTGQMAGGRLVELGFGPGDVFRGFGGTSSAAPLVAGICGLLFSLRPQLTAAEVKDLLTSTARPIGDPALYVAGRSRLFGFGCVDAAAAVRELKRRYP